MFQRSPHLGPFLRYQFPKYVIKINRNYYVAQTIPTIPSAQTRVPRNLISSVGTEVKAIREGRVNLRDSFARLESGEVFLYNVNISPYSHRGYADHEPLRRRKLLLHRDEIRKLIGKTVEKGMTSVPTRMYFKNGRVKVAVSLAKEKEYDKRETIKRREADRETRAAIKSRQ